MKKDFQILANSYKELFYKTMNPVFFTLASYITYNKSVVLLNEQTKEDELAL